MKWSQFTGFETDKLYDYPTWLSLVVSAMFKAVGIMFLLIFVAVFSIFFLIL